jgi:DNA-binding NarL/FixJ family response regulator
MSQESQTSAPVAVLALGRDLMFSSKIAAEGRAAGVGVKIVRDPAALPGLAARLLLADLALDGAIEAAAAWSLHTRCPVIGFVSHVDEQTIARAKQAGLDKVMSRGSFTRQLPQIFRDLKG